jgi:uncharacterized protein (DUF4415 family)
MSKRRLPLTNEDGEVRELTREDFRGMRPVREAMPALIETMAEFRRKLGRPKAEAPKVHIGFRLAADVVESVKASGPGYNARVEQALREAGFGAKVERQADTVEADTVKGTDASGRTYSYTRGRIRGGVLLEKAPRGEGDDRQTKGMTAAERPPTVAGAPKPRSRRPSHEA